VKRGRMLALLLAVGGNAATPFALAIEPIPDTSGWRGFVVGGAGYTDLKSNLVAGNGLLDIGRDTINSVGDAAQSDDALHPIFTGEVNYTFGNRWQAFLGTSLEDAVTLDGVAQVGLRRDRGATGVLQGGVLFSGVPTDVWEDPYAEGVPRDETDRDSTGLRVQWDRILGSAFEITLSYRDIEIDTERSGRGVISVTCDAACRTLLRRDGEQFAGALSYLFTPGQGNRHFLRPLLRYTTHDLDGEALSGESYQLQLSYSYRGEGYLVVSNVAVGGRDYDSANPIFGRKTDSDRLVVDATLLYRLPFASGRWQAVGTVLWGEDDSDVDFHDNEVFHVSLGAMYRFGSL